MDNLIQGISRLERYQNSLQTLQDSLISSMISIRDPSEIKATSFILSHNNTTINEISAALSSLKSYTVPKKKKNKKSKK